jgi:hypothetical protein
MRDDELDREWWAGFMTGAMVCGVVSMVAYLLSH